MTNLSKTVIAVFVIFGSLVTSPALALVEHQWWMATWYCSNYLTPGLTFPRVELTYAIVPSLNCEGGGCTTLADGLVLYSRPKGRNDKFTYQVTSANSGQVSASETDLGNTFLNLRKMPAVGNQLQMSMVETIEGKEFKYECQTQNYKLNVRTTDNTISWRLLPGRARDIGVGADGSVWIIGTSPVGAAGDFSIYRFAGTYWAVVSGGAVRIAVGPNGVPWIVNSAGQIFRREGNAWKPLPGRAKDIGVGADGTVWIIGTNPVGTAGDFGIYSLVGGSWVAVEGGAVRISVAPDGMPWIVNAAGQIFRRRGDSWRDPYPGFGKDIGVGPDSSVWLIATGRVGNAADFGIFEWDGSNWAKAPGGGIGIAVGPNSVPWMVNSAGSIYRLGPK
jgi:Tectonin domain